MIWGGRGFGLVLLGCSRADRGTVDSRPVSDIRADLVAAQQRADSDAVRSLEAELSTAADQATHVTGGKRGS